MNLEALLNTLERDIMNLSSKVDTTGRASISEREHACKEGHRDARHAAAELVAAFASKLEGDLK